MCRRCGSEFSLASNLFVGNGPSGRFLGKLAYWRVVPLGIVLTVLFLSSKGLWSGRGAGWGAVFLLLVLYVLLSVMCGLLVFCCPKSSRVRCWICSLFSCPSFVVESRVPSVHLFVKWVIL